MAGQPLHSSHRMMVNEPPASHFSWLAVGLWVGLTIPGYIFAGFLHMPGDGPPGVFRIQDLDLFAGFVGFVFGAVTGLGVSALQWLALKSRILNARSWIPLNMIGFGLVHALNDAGVFTRLPVTLSLVVDGIVIGLAQAIALRGALSRIYTWLLVTAIAWLLGFQTAYALERVPASDPTAFLLAGYGASGLIIGAMTGTALKLLVQERPGQDRKAQNPGGNDLRGGQRTPIPKFMLRLFSQMHVAVYRISKGNHGNRMNGLPVLLLTSTGRYSGKPHTVPVVYLDEAGNCLIAPGIVPRPDWYLNLKHEPQAEIQVGAEKFLVTADELDGSERERWWATVPEYWKAYAERAATKLPLMRLRRE